MKHIFTFLIILPSFVCSQSLAVKDEKELTKAVAENSFSEKMVEIHEKELERLRSSQKQSDRILQEAEEKSYSRNRVNLINSIDVLNQIILTVDLIESDRKHQKVGAILQKVNNPTSDVLGFKFVNVVENAVQQRIAESIQMESEKSRIKNMFSNLIKGLSQSFPALNVISSVISVFASVSHPVLDKVNVSTKKKASTIVNSYNETALVFSGEQMEKFTNELLPYTNFYTSLEKQNNSFEKELMHHSYKYRDFLNEISLVSNVIKATYGVEAKDIDSDHINKLFKYPNSTTYQDFYGINNLDQVRKSPRIVVSICDLMKEFLEYYSSYSQIIDTNITSSLTILEDSKKLPAVKDKTPIQATIDEINDLWSSTVNSTSDKSSLGKSFGFRNKFGNMISKTKQFYSKIERY